MSGEDQYRNRTLKLLEEECGISFKEEDLSPEIRKKIRILSNRLKEIDQLSLDFGKRKERRRFNKINSYFFMFFGCCLLFGSIFQITLTILKQGLFSPFLFGMIYVDLLLFVGSVIIIVLGRIAYESYILGLKQLEEINEETSKLVKDKWDSDLGNVSKEAFDELKEVHDVKFYPTIKQEVIQYNISTKFEFGKNGALIIECPHCKASSELKSKANPIKCSYCSKEYFVPNKILQLL